jgi:ABC-type Fe3+/spermidine/putrescine transport system ATPase subunit
MAPAIETHDLTKRYGELVAVDRLNFAVERGEILGLLGPNGAGKTTVISMLSTILKPTQGTAKVNGFDILSDPDDVRKSIGIVFQEPSVDDELTGLENLPPWLTFLTYIDPVTYGVDGMRGILLGTSRFPILLNFSALASFALVMIWAGTFAFKRMQ